MSGLNNVTNEHDQVPSDPSDGDRSTCSHCGVSHEFVVLDDGLPGEWVERHPDRGGPMTTCATCVHWKPPTGRDGYGDAIQIGPRGGDRRPLEVRYGEAREAQRQADVLFGECGAICLREIELGDPIPLAVAMDGSQYMANLFTQAEFGCAMWEAKP